MAKISVIIPVYKVKESYLRSCIESVLNQTERDIQIIIVDDGAPDHCASICDEYDRKDTRIEVLHCKNGGVSIARNRGIAKAVGEYLLFIDADDWVESDICETVYEFAKKQEAEVTIFNYDKRWKNRVVSYPLGEVNQKYKKQDMIELQLKILRYTSKFKRFNVCTPWCKLYQTDFIKQNKIEFMPGLKRGEDMLFNLYALEKAERVSSLDYIGYHYRINEDSESQVYTPEVVQITNDVLNCIDKFIKENQKDEIFVSGYYAYSIEVLYEQMHMYFFHKENPLSYSLNKKNFMEVIKKPPFYQAPYKVKLGRLSQKLRILVIFQRLHLMRVFCCIYYINKKIKNKKKKS